MAKIFNKPQWLKPEIDEFKYYIHLLVIAVIVLGILQYFIGSEMLTIKNISISMLLLLVSDIVAHTLLRLN